ncbi:hypothetical protein GCM10011416_20850 [Polaribacter pacificus]|uniref:Uncharacterized protein n=1 Tax=Polaribacter pacificus TaxID=1775173 RepID=A0A917I0I6_9FLAO|nr:hypothetical protein [Polaribacter pacificus]GGH01906.1 hypothetical protein GCM10011416_20850 [Polaribacter pacificus]
MIKNIFRLFFLVVFSITFIQCGDGGKFSIAKGKVGQLNTKTKILELENIFKNDSIVKNLSEGSLGDDYFQDDDEYLIYEKGGKHLLTIIPKEQLDSTSTIKSVQIFDKRYKTKTDLSLTSTFEEINLSNNISKVETTLSSATLFIDELNVTISLDKEELGLKSFTTQKVTLEQIPGLAKIKTFIVWFN